MVKRYYSVATLSIILFVILLAKSIGICQNSKIKFQKLYFNTGYLLVKENYSDKTNSLKTGLNEQFPIGLGVTFSKPNKLEHTLSLNYRTLMFSDFIWKYNPFLKLLSSRYGPYKSISTNYVVSKKLDFDSKLRSFNVLAGIELLIIPENLSNRSDMNREFDNYGGAYFWQNDDLIFSMKDSSKITSPIGLNLLFGFEIQNRSDKNFFCSFQPVYSIGLVKIHETFARFDDIINNKSGDAYISTNGGYLGIVFKFGFRKIKTNT